MTYQDLSVPPEVTAPYEKLLIEERDYIHRLVESIMNTKLEDVRRTKVTDIPELLKLFKGSTPKRQKEALVEFLKIMPEYRTTDQDLLLQRLRILKRELKREHEITDLLTWAKLRYQRSQLQSSASENET